MWLTSSSVGRKFIMALTGICLVLFVTFHCLMNSIAIVWPAAYNVICEFLGANWYALIASMGLAVLFIIHIIYAVWLTVMNRKARGNDRYLINKTPKAVEWSSKNMLVLGIVILAFLVVHLIQFWAKMQLEEVLGHHGTVPAAAGTLFIQEAFKEIWTPIVYIIGFVALWFHMTHGFWSMFQSIGWDSTVWIPRWKKIGDWWTSIVVALFVAQAIVFTVQSQKDYYSTQPELQAQYMEMAVAPLNETLPMLNMPSDMQTVKMTMAQIAPQADMMLGMMKMQMPGVDIQTVGRQMLNIVNLVNYLDPTANLPVEALQRAADGQMQQPQMQPQMMGQPQAQPQAQPEQAPQGEPRQVSPEQQAADDAPAQEPANPNDKQK